MDDFGLDLLSDAELGQLAAHVAAASADARAQAGAEMTDDQRNEINTIEMDAQEQWLRDRQDTQGMNEPGAAYDDSENQAIPGGGRAAWLKKQAELRAKNELPGAKRIQWWTDIGHKPGKAAREKTWLWAYDKQGKLKVINAWDLRNMMMEDGNLISANPTHLDWEEMFQPGLLAGPAHGRIDATGDVIRVSLAGRISDDTFRQQVKHELAVYIGADVDKVKGYDFTGDGMPEVFDPAAGYDDGENQPIPGGEREARLKAKPPARKTYYTDIGHNPDNADNSYLYLVDSKGVMQLIRVSDLQDYIRKNAVPEEGEQDPYLKAMGRKENPGYSVPGSDSVFYEDENGELDLTDVTHNDWSPASNGSGKTPWKKVVAYGRVEVKDGKPVIAVGSRGGAAEKFGDIRAVIRAAAEAAIANGEITGVTQRAIGMDFVSNEDNGQPGIFEPGAGYGENANDLKRRLSSGPGNGTMTKEDVIQAARESFGDDVIQALIDAGVLNIVDDPSETDMLTPLEADEIRDQQAQGKFGVQGFAEGDRAVLFATQFQSNREVEALILHEVGRHIAKGKDLRNIRQIFDDMVFRSKQGGTEGQVARDAVCRAIWAMVNDPRFKRAVSLLGGDFVQFRGMEFSEFEETITDDQIDAMLDAMLVPAGGVNQGGRASDKVDRQAFAAILMEEVGAYVANARLRFPESELVQGMWEQILGYVRRMVYNITGGRYYPGRFTTADVVTMARDDVRDLARNAGQDNAQGERRFSIKKRGRIGETNQEVEKKWRNQEASDPDPIAGTTRWVEEFNKRKKAGADGRAEMSALGISTEINLSDGTKFQMPDDIVQAWNNNASQSTGEGFEASDVEDPRFVERLNYGVRKIAPQAPTGNPVNPASEMMVNGKPVFNKRIRLLNGKRIVMQFGNQLGKSDNSSGYGFQHGMKHAMEIIFSHAIRTMKPGETELDAMNRLTQNGTSGVQAYVDALNYFYENADVKVVVKDAGGNEIKTTLVDSKSGVMINARPTSDGSYSFTTAFHMAKPAAGEKASARMNNGKFVREDMARRDAGTGIETEAAYIISFDTYRRLFENKAPAGSTIEVDASMTPEPMRSALQKAVNRATEVAPEGKATRISINTNTQTNASGASAETGTAGVESAVSEVGEPSVEDEVGGDTQNPAPTSPPPMPPQPPAPVAPGAAPVNPEVSAWQRAWDIVTLRYFSGISVKAHQNARRFQGASIQAVADLIHNRPGSQGSAAPRSIPASIATARGKFTNRFRDIMAPLRDQLAGMDTAGREAFYESLTDMITGRRNMGTGLEGQVADNLKKLLAEMHAYRLAAGEELGEIEDYFPVVYNSDLITKNRAGFLADAERAYRIEMSSTLSGPELDAAAAAAALALYNTHVRGMGAQEFGSLFNRSTPGGRENSSKERTFGRQAQNIMRKWQSNDPFLVITRYIGGAVKSAELARRFGADGMGWESYAKGMEAEGVPQEIIEEMYQLVTQAAGVNTPGLGKTGQGFMDFVALYTAATSLGKSFMSNLFEPIAMGIRTGSPIYALRAYGETWTRSLNEFLKDVPIARMLAQESFWQQYGEHIGTIHNSLEDAWMTTHSMELGMDNQNPRMRWLTNRVYKANLMDATETAKQQASHALGHSYIGDLCKMISGSHWMNAFGMDASRSARQDLIELGVPESEHQAFIAWMDALKAAKPQQRMTMMTDGSPMSKLYEEAQVRFTNQSAVRANRAHRPVFQDNLMGKMFLQLQSFSYSYAAEANSRIYDNLKRSAASGDYTMADRMRLIAPAMMLPLAIAAFAGMFKLRRELYPTEATMKRDNDPWWAQFVDAASYAGMFGPKVEQAMKFVMRDQPPGGIVGQHAINTARAAKGYATAAIGPDEKYDKAMASANKAAVKAAIPPVKGAVVVGASAINPILGTAASMLANDTTLSNAAIEATQPEPPDKKRESKNPYNYRQPRREPGR